LEPEWSDFKVLLALASAGSVAGAARALAVDNSTVSRRLAALEEASGARLIIRGGREFTWTTEGRTLLSAAEVMETAVAQATRQVRTAKTETEGTVRVSMAPAFLPVLMRLFLPTLRQTHPGLHVELSGDYHRVDLARGQADMAVRMARPSEPDLVVRRALEVNWFAYASMNYLASHGQPGNPQSLSEHRLVMYVESMHHIAPLRWMEDYRGDARQVSRVDNLEIACQTIAADAGIAVLPCFIADAVPQLRRIFSSPVGSNTGWIVYHETHRDTARIRVMTDALATFFERHAGVFAGDLDAASAPLELHSRETH
jgi:DNA-binding transcriptional LysR family regulator